METYRAVSTPSDQIVLQSWWPTLHTRIIESFLSKNHSVFPPTWTRLDPDPMEGAKGLQDELGHHGMLVIILGPENKPVACSGVLPYRGDNWIKDAKAVEAAMQNSTAPATWNNAEIACFCVHPSHRRKGLARRLLSELITLVKPRGAERLIANYAIDETGDFWKRLGFAVISGAGGILPKGFQTDPEKEGLRADIHFDVAALQI